MRKQAPTHICAITAIAVTLTLLAYAFAQPSTAAADSDAKFAIIWITDTQYLSENHQSYYDNLCRWIVQNKDVYNVKMVVHTGDIVNDEDKRSQWLNANHSMGILLDSGVPYCWDAGNHDYDDNTWIGNQYAAFNPEVMGAKSYWVGDEFGGMNTAVGFSVSGWDCLIVNVAFHANDSVLAWANNLLDANPQSHVIVATHDYLNKDGEYDSWGTNFKNTVLDTHANVFLTLSGHYHPSAGARKLVGGREELMFDMQDTNDDAGAASARILTFDTSKGTIDVQTYNANTNQFLMDENSNFTVNTSFRNDGAGDGFPVVVVAAVSVAVSAVVVGLFFVKVRAKKSRLS